MIKKLLFALILTTFSVLSTMAQNAPFDLFIGTTNNLNYFWSKQPNGFVWNNSKDSVGAVTYASPYEGADHMEFNYNTTGWWCAGAFTLNPFPFAPENLSGYTHLKLYWKGYSAANPNNSFRFSLIDSAGNTGPGVVVFDNCNNGTYQEKIVPLKSFLGIVYDWQNLPIDTLADLTAIEQINYSVIIDESYDNSWDGESVGVWYMDAVQLVDWMGVDAGGVPVFHSDTFDFGVTSTETPTAATTFTIKNAGGSNLILSGTPKVTISGDAADFTIVQSGVTSPIAPSGTTSFTVTFNPSTIGTKTATLSIANDFSPTGNYVIVLTGTGHIGPEINLQAGTTSVASGETVDFGILVAGTSKDTTFTIYNLGNADLALSSITISGASEFTLVQTGVTSPVVPSGTTSFTVTYNPTSAGVKNAAITITNDDVNEGTYLINLTGSATLVPEPEINVKAGTTSVASTGSFGFGSVNTGANSTVTFTIENLGNADLNLTGTPKIAVSGAADFTVNETATSIAAGGSTTFTVTFAPTSAGAKSAAITIANDDVDEGTYVINLTGLAILAEPEINVKAGFTSVASAGSFGFGSVNTGASSTVTFTIENPGNADLNLTGIPKIAVSGTDAAAFTVNVTATTSPVAAGSSTTFTVTFAPSSAGTKNATIAIANNDTDESVYTIYLTGTATSTFSPEINIRQGSTNIASSETYDFGSVTTVAYSTITFTIENIGNSVLNLTYFTMTGTHTTDFTMNLTGTYPTIAAGGSTTFAIIFTPSSAGVKSAVFIIANNDADEGNYVINLTGTGTAATGLFGSASANSFEALVGPNPSNGIYNINTSEKIDEVIVSDCMGNILLNNSDSQIDLSNQPSGVYFLTIISGEKRFFGKLLKN